MPEGSTPASPLFLLFPAFSQEFWKFATIEAIQRTEIFEYCQMLGRPKSFIPSFQVTEPGGGPISDAVSRLWVARFLALLFGTWYHQPSHLLHLSSLAGVWEGSGFLFMFPEGQNFTV